MSPVSREAELGSASHHMKGDPGHHRLAVRRHIARPQGDRGKLRGHRQKRPEVPADAGTAQGQRLCAARPGWGDQQSRPGLGPSVGPFLSCAPGPAWPPSLPPRPPACGGPGGWAIPTSHVSPPGPGADPDPLTPSPTTGPRKACAPGHQTPPPNHRITQSLCSSVLDSSSQPPNHPNLR